MKSSRLREHGRVRLLLVEDDYRLASLVAERLTAEGYEVTWAFSGPQGLDLASSGRFDFVLLDVMLPGLDGVTLVRSLRERGLHVPVLMLSARDAANQRVEGLRAGADDYLVKPFAFNELLARIEARTRGLAQGHSRSSRPRRPRNVHPAAAPTPLEETP